MVHTVGITISKSRNYRSESLNLTKLSSQRSPCLVKMLPQDQENTCKVKRSKVRVAITMHGRTFKLQDGKDAHQLVLRGRTIFFSLIVSIVRVIVA